MRKAMILIAACLASGLLQASSCSCAQIVGSSAGAGAGLWYLSRAPSHEIEQIYYLGAFDPQEQLPPAVYRITVRGQSSAMSAMKFGSGWVHASLIDSLGTSLQTDKETGQVKITRGDEKDLVSLETGRRMMLFGPEGFRVAPRDHRLVIVMGSSPDKFFQAIDEVLGQVATTIHEQNASALKTKLMEAMAAAHSERSRLSDLEKDLDPDLKGKD